MVSGVLSSIFIATPLLAWLKRDTGRKSYRKRLLGDELRAAVIGAGVTGRIGEGGSSRSARRFDRGGRWPAVDADGDAGTGRVARGAASRSAAVASSASAQEEAALIRAPALVIVESARRR